PERTPGPGGHARVVDRTAEPHAGRGGAGGDRHRGRSGGRPCPPRGFRAGPGARDGDRGRPGGPRAAAMMTVELYKPFIPARTRLLVSKLIAITTCVLFAVIAVTVTSYLIGIFLLGPGAPAAVGQPGSPVTGPGGIVSGGAPTAGVQAGSSVTSLSGAPLTLL